MAKRLSGPPRRPRNPVAKAVRGPAFHQRVVPDKRRQTRLTGGRAEKDDMEKASAEAEPPAEADGEKDR